MLIPRIIPCLLLDNNVFVKTRQFKKPHYVGDPINVINLFNRFEVDEIVLLDIRATVNQREPQFELIEKLASECWVPLAYGGGIRTLDQVKRLFQIGIEKIVLNTAAIENPDLIRQAAEIYGSQAVVVSIDVRRSRLWEAWSTRSICTIASGTKRIPGTPIEVARQVEAQGAGEILLMSIDREGEMQGYDLELIRQVSAAVSIPVVANGGAGCRDDLNRPLQEAGASAVAAGSLFVYQNKERGVLINFPKG